VSEDVAGTPRPVLASLRRSQELVTARRLVADELMTEGEFLSVVGRVLLEVGAAGLVELLAAQATFTSIALERLVGEDQTAEWLATVAQLLALTQEVRP
jgi:hypothetical protein